VALNLEFGDLAAAAQNLELLASLGRHEKRSLGAAGVASP
jgi:hypothetical protein